MEFDASSNNDKDLLPSLNPHVLQGTNTVTSSPSLSQLKSPDLDGFEFSFIDIRANPSYCTNNETSTIPTTRQGIVDSALKQSSQKSTNGRSRRHKKGQTKRSFATKERHVIQHNYHDHANDVIDFDEYTGETIGLDPIKKKGGVAIPFPLKLHELLEKVDEEGLQHIVSWQPHGRAFVVREPKKFVADLMPRFFRQTKLTSFQRQLNLYGFSRLTRGPDSGGYYHELFLRGKPHLTRRMVRTKIKGTGYKAASNPACEPDFYNMSPVGPGYHNPRMSMGDSTFGCGMLDSSRVMAPIPVVTPNSSHNDNHHPIATFDEHNSHPGIHPLHQGEMTGFEISDNPQEVKSSKHFLKPRHHSRAVKMGNEHFHYIESLKKVSSNPYSSEDVSSRSSCTSSPILFERMSSDETSSTKDNEEDPSQDPLTIFLADMGEDFEDDLVFGCETDNAINDDETFPNPSIYEV